MTYAVSLELAAPVGYRSRRDPRDGELRPIDDNPDSAHTDANRVARTFGGPIALPPTPSPAPTGGSQVIVTVVAPFRVGVPGQIAYRVADTETLAKLSVRLSGPDGGVARSEMSPASASGTLSSTFQMPGTYDLTVTATTRSGSVLEGTVAVHVEP